MRPVTAVTQAAELSVSGWIGCMPVKIKHKIASQELYQSIRDYLPRDHSRHQSLECYLAGCIPMLPESARVLDLGCGEGNSIELFQRLSAGIVWRGVDLEDSPEARQRLHGNENISIFNGVDLPYPDNSFDLIFCRQVLEHARHPDALIADALRVLKPDGLFVGSVSYLEPYHSYSIFNFTPYGIVRVFADAGFRLTEIRPGNDASAVMLRQMFNRSDILRPVWRRNFLYGIFAISGILLGLGHRERNFLKVQFSGHLLFSARKPSFEQTREIKE